MTDREKLVELLKQPFQNGEGISLEDMAVHLLLNGVMVQPVHKAADCKFYTTNSFWGAGCLGTKEVEPCNGDKCERWQPKEE